jgi:hypothetical protein
VGGHWLVLVTSGDVTLVPSGRRSDRDHPCLALAPESATEAGEESHVSGSGLLSGG